MAMRIPFFNQKQAKESFDYREDQTPEHIAIIMDGNGRWAQKRGLPRVAGHKEGISAVLKTVRLQSNLM